MLVLRTKSNAVVDCGEGGFRYDPANFTEKSEFSSVCTSKFSKSFKLYSR